MSFHHQIPHPIKNTNSTNSKSKNITNSSEKKTNLQMKSDVLTRGDINHLQKIHGNQAIQRMLANTPIQRLEIPDEEDLQMKSMGEPIQKMEEADEELQMKSVGEPIQKMGGLEDEELQMKPIGEPIQKMGGLEDEELQMKLKGVPIQRKSPDGGLPSGIKEQMESALGADFSGVKINEGNEASAVNALAYAQGNDLHFAPGQYKPETEEGRSLLGHELAHVVQQREGRVETTTEANGMPVNDDPSLEKEADVLGSKAAKHIPKSNDITVGDSSNS